MLLLLYSYILTAPTQANPYIEHAKIALLVYNKILEDEGVYLLPALITERHLLCCKLTKATSCSDADAVVQAWESKKSLIFSVHLFQSWAFDDLQNEGFMKKNISNFVGL